MEGSDTQAGRRAQRDLLRSVLRGEGELGRRLARLRAFSKGVRTSEYHLTNACNLRCKGCWFFEYDYDTRTTDLSSVEAWRMFAKDQAETRKITSALLIGGEPTLYPERIAAFVEHMSYVTISSNGLRKLPVEGFEQVGVALTLFGGGEHDDHLRARRPDGQTFKGLFDKVLENYRNDKRAGFVYALTEDGIGAIQDTVSRIQDNGNTVSFNYYSDYGADVKLHRSGEAQLLDEALRAKDMFPEAVVNDPYYIRTLITGKTEWGEFGYAVCPSISVDHEAHRDRLANGHPVLPGFNTYAADGRTLNFCCTSGDCGGCRDSQAVYSWLLVSGHRFMKSPADLEKWVQVVEGYWSQFPWSPFHRSATGSWQGR